MIRKNRMLVLIILLLIAARLPAEEHDHVLPESCTSIMVGKKASIDGSVITSHSCDGNYRTWLNIVPAQTFSEGEKDKVRWGTMHTETAWDIRGIVEKGEIPQVSQTYGYLNVSYPAMNEKSLAIGETTIGGRRELFNDEGLFVIEELQRIALQRCTTARQAIRLIGDLVKEFGYGDRGECLTFADKNEVWHFEIFGEGKENIGAVWAAARIPDNHVGVSANIPRIGALDLNNSDYYMASDNVYSVAEAYGWWSPDSGEFKFWKAYSGRKPFGIRDFYILSTLAPRLNLSIEMDELPFSVKPDKKVSVRDIIAYFRETYENTEWDMTKNLMVERMRRGRVDGSEQEEPDIIKSPAANPWMHAQTRHLLNTLQEGAVEPQRTIAIAGCSYSQIIQIRDWLPDEMAGIAWFSFDNPGQSPRIPIFAGTLNLPSNFHICGQHRYRTDSALWHFRRANRLATVQWGTARESMEQAIMDYEDKAFEEVSMIEKKALELYKNDTIEDDAPEWRKYLTRYTHDFARAAMNRWWELGNEYWFMFGRGF